VRTRLKKTARLAEIKNKGECNSSRHLEIKILEKASGTSREKKKTQRDLREKKSPGFGKMGREKTALKKSWSSKTE